MSTSIERCRAKDKMNCRYHGRAHARLDEAETFADQQTARIGAAPVDGYTQEAYHEDVASYLTTVFRSRTETDSFVAHKSAELQNHMAEKPQFGEYWLSDGAGSYKVHRDEMSGKFWMYAQIRSEEAVALVDQANKHLEQLAQRRFVAAQSR